LRKRSKNDILTALFPPRRRTSGVPGREKERSVAVKVLVLSHQGRYERFAPRTSAAYRAAELVFCGREESEEAWLAAGADADALFVTPVTWVRESLMARMPNLKLIHSEGVGFDRIDLDAAARRGIYVCNNAGCNAEAVAEQAVMMMSLLLHRTLWGHRMVLDGRQGEAVMTLEGDVPRDLSDVTVGLVGFGAIGQATARRLRANGSRVVYYARHRRSGETEAACGAEYLPLERLAEECDIVSLHLPATAESAGLVNEAFLARMKPGSFLVNTARGAVVDDAALCAAIRSGQLAGAALDAYVPEPVPPDHPLVELAKDCPDRVLLCPHQGGLTLSSFRNVYRMLFENLERLMAGQRPDRVVNGI